MDEHKDEDASGSTVLEETKKTVSAQVVGGCSEKTRVVDPVASDVEIRGQFITKGSSTGGVVAEGGGGRSCNADDIMVRVMDSDTYVDGVCNFGDGGGGDFGAQAATAHGGSKESNLERERKSLGDDSGSKATVDSGVEAPNLGTESEVGNSSGVGESKEEGECIDGRPTFKEITCVGGDDVIDDKFSQEVGAGSSETVELISVVEVYSLFESSTSVEIQDAAEKLVVAAGQEIHVGEVSDVSDDKTLKDVEKSGEIQITGEKVAAASGEECIEKDDIDVIKDVSSQEAGASENEAQDQRVVNGAHTLAVLGTSLCETKVISAEDSELVEEAVDQAKGTSGCGGEALHGSETEKVCVLHDEVWNPRIQTAGAPSPTTMEGSSAETQVSEKAVVVSNDENVIPKVEASVERTRGSDAMEGVISSSGKISFSTETDGIANANSEALDEQTQVAVASAISKSSDEQTQAAVDGKIASTDKEEIACPDIEGMDTDAFNENFCFSVEELQTSIETVNGSTENHYDTFADLQTLQQPNQVVVGGEDVATKNKVLLNSEDHKKLLIEEYSEDSMLHDSAQIHSSIQTDMGIDKQVTRAQQDKVDTTNESTETYCTIGLDSTASYHSAQAAVSDESTEIDDKDHSDCNVEAPIEMHLDEMFSVSGNNQHVKTEMDSMEIDIQTGSTDKDKALFSVPAEKDQMLKLRECLDERAVCGAAQVDSNIGQLMIVQESVTHIEQNSEAETVCASTVTDTVVWDGGKTANKNNDVTLNPDTGLERSAEGDQNPKVEEGLDENRVHSVSEIESIVRNESEVENHDADFEQFGLEQQEMEAEEQDTDSEQPKATEEKSSKQSGLNPGNTAKGRQASYELPPDDEDEFTVSDLVWGKVRSHPWWPGQIFDASDASEKAMKYHKKDCFLVAYFGDRTFAWNEASLLKPFRSHFSQVEKLSNSEAFQNAVDCALEEVSRRVEFGLACSCIPCTPEDIYEKIKFQIVENAGIRHESSVKDYIDRTLHADLFEPGKLMDYLKALAACPADGADRLELVIAKSQLLSFYRLKAYSRLPEFQFCGGLSDNADAVHFADEVTVDTSVCDGHFSSGQEILQIQRSAYHKRKHNLKDTIYPRKKEKSLSGLMGESWDSVDDEIGPDEKASNKLVSPSAAKKRKVSDSFADDLAMLEGRKTISLAKVSTTVTPVPKPSFKIGECIRRVASQMTGSPSILKSNSQKQDGSSDGVVGDGSDVFFVNCEDAEIRGMTDPTEYSSLDELLSQLHLAARDPLEGYSFMTIIISFFSDFRNSVTMEQHEKVGGKRRQAFHSIGSFPETFEFEDMNDTYWTDRVIQNGSEEQPSRKSRKRDIFVPVNLDKPPNRTNSRNNCLSAEKPVGYVDEKAPAELVMHFPVVDKVPSETSLNKMFRRFGPLKESETEVDKDTNRARVVFKKSSDAEAAYGSASKFSIFGSMLVNYQLNYTISVPFKSEPVAPLEGEEDATLFLQF